MANLYTLYGNGTFESGSPNLSFRSALRTTIVGNAAKSSTDAYEGTKSLRIAATAGLLGGSGNGAHALLLPYLRYYKGTFNNVTLTQGKKYRAKCKVKTTSANPIANPEALILFGGFNPGGVQITGSGFTITNLANDRVKMEYTGVIGAATVFIEMTAVYVSGATDAWAEVEYVWQEIATDTDAKNLTVSVELYKVNDNGGGGTILDLTQGGIVQNEVLTGGELYIDGLTIEEVAECDLALDSPSYTKTNETAALASDGTITIHADSSYTIEYSKDNVNWQLSNLFTGLAPGDYTIYLRDSNDCTTQTEVITISAFVADPPPPEPTPGPLTIDHEPVNRYNFISWFAADGPTDFTEILGDNCDWDLPKGYNKDRDEARVHAPIMARNEVNAFYINFDTPATDPTHADFKLGLFNQQGLVEADLGALSTHDITTGNYNIYASSVIIPVDILPGYYRMMIYRQTDGAVLWVSNLIEVMSTTEADKQSVRLDYRHSYNVYKYYYEMIDSDFLNRIRLRLYRVDENAEGNLEQYRAASNGRLRNVSFELDKYLTLEAYWFDDLAHRAMMVLQMHALIQINDKLYLPKSMYKWEFNPMLNLNKGRIELYEQDFSTANRYQPLTSITIVGSEDPLLLGDEGARIKL